MHSDNAAEFMALGRVVRVGRHAVTGDDRAHLRAGRLGVGLGLARLEEAPPRSAQNSNGFKARQIQRMAGPEGISAGALAEAT